MNSKIFFLSSLLIRYQLLFRITLFLYAGLVIWVYIRPGGGPQPIEHFDKIMHLVFYGLFTVIAAGCSPDKMTFIRLAAFIACYGTLMEVFQSFLPSRFMSVADIVANVSGIVLIVLFFLKLRIHNSQEVR